MSALRFSKTGASYSCESGSCSGHRKARYRMTILDHPAGLVCQRCKSEYMKVWRDALS